MVADDAAGAALLWLAAWLSRSLPASLLALRAFDIRNLEIAMINFQIKLKTSVNVDIHF